MNELLKAISEPEPELKQFDDFFVGGGSAMNMSRKAVSFPDLIIKSDKSVVAVHVDLARFTKELVKVFNYKEVFIESKGRAYSVFDYLSIKSEKCTTPMTASDLIFDEDNKYVVEGLAVMGLDRAAVSAIAELSAWREMQIDAVRFKPMCECSLCKVLAGKLILIDEALNLFGYGSGLTHKGCECHFTPLVDRRRSYGALDKVLNIEEVSIGSKKVFGVPRELYAELEPLLQRVDQGAVEFLDLEKYLKEAGTVVWEEDGVLLVHNNYIYGKDPVDYLRSYLDMEVLCCGELVGEPFYYKGKKVVASQGYYWDVETKERV